MTENIQKAEANPKATPFPEGAGSVGGKGNFKGLPRCWDVGGGTEEVAAGGSNIGKCQKDSWRRGKFEGVFQS